MRLIPGGVFWMGSDKHYPEERPARLVEVDRFWIDENPVTNRAFRAFVASTGYVTTAEIAPSLDDYPNANPSLLKAGSALFIKPNRNVSLRDPRAWWHLSIGTCWRRPWGPHTTIDAILDHPVVHVTYADAVAYANWAGRRIPSEAEWEFACRGGLDRKDFAWGADLAPGGVCLANYWQGIFPWQNLLEDGFERTSPVQTFPSNGYGLHDMVGNVWEWTCDRFSLPPKEGHRACCGLSKDAGLQTKIGEEIPTHVIKGGSHLCAPNYCKRYRPAARYAQPVDTSTSHIGFRCAL